MKIFFLLTAFLLFLQNSHAQNAKADSLATPEKMCVTIGILQGGGSIIGVDVEFLLTPRVGIQGGAGFLAYGAGLNYHFKPELRSSFLSLVYWHQGFGDRYTQSVIGPTIVYRSKKWFTAQLGIGARVGTGPAMPDGYENTPVLLLYSIGAYLAQ